jgi:PAS domain S-box-containing protein
MSQQNDLIEFGSENAYRLLVQRIKDYAIYMLRPDGVVASWNAGAQRFKGYTADEIIGQHYSVFYEEPDRLAGLPATNLALALREGKFEDEGWRVRKDGSRFWAHVVIDPIYQEDGRLLGFAKITRDRTEQLETNEKILFMARHDAMTGLPNRVHFLERLDEAMSTLHAGQQQVAVVSIDLDGFKEINDAFGAKKK